MIILNKKYILQIKNKLIKKYIHIFISLKKINIKYEVDKYQKKF